jgi:hypothetical protein
MASAEERRAALRESIERFVKVVEGLPEERFLHVVDGRTPRDIAAHLIGWNYLAAEASGFLRRGELPPSLVEPGPDFSRVNGESMARFASRDKGTLLGQLRESGIAYDRMLRDLPAAEWDANRGVMFGNWAVTNGDFVGVMLGEFEHHRREIESWPMP